MTLSRLLQTSLVHEHTENIHLKDAVLCEIDDDPFVPPMMMWVMFIVIDKQTLELQLKGFEDDGTVNFKSSLLREQFRVVTVSPKGFRLKEDMA